MYLPDHFKPGDEKQLHALIAAYPLGVLVTHGLNGLDANHIPFEFDAEQGPSGTLHAHVARANPVWQEVRNGDEVLVIFRAEHSYISPNWYPTKQENHKSVPTWNYSVVHAHGKITIRDDERYVRTVIARLTHHHEASQPQPWKMSDAPKDYMADMVTKIVGVEVEVSRLIGKFKLSQNREARDITGVIGALEKQGDQALAETVSEHAPKR